MDAARELFVENGYAATSMSDIAIKAGVNRPVLHYYFRTKDKMFGAVFGSIVNAIVPRVHDIVLRHDLPLAERVGMVIDVYYEMLMANPCLPVFMMREMQRDFGNVARTMYDMHIVQYIETIKRGLLNEMDNGTLCHVPLRYVFMTFYSMVIMPFVAKNLCCSVLLEDGESFEDLLAKWKLRIVDTIVAMLTTIK